VPFARQPLLLRKWQGGVDRGTRDGHRDLHIAAAVRHDGQHSELWLAQRLVAIGDLRDAVRAYHTHPKGHPVPEIDRTGPISPPPDPVSRRSRQTGTQWRARAAVA
jgi:hypothetical protein